MKKYSIYGLASLFALSFAACDNYEEPNPRPQTNPQEPVLAVSDVVVTQDVSADAAYDLKALNDEGKNIVLSTINCSDLPEGYEFVADAEISANGFARSASVPVSVVAANDSVFSLEVNPDDLQGVYYANISKDPKKGEIQLRYVLKTKTGNQVAYVGNPDNFYGPYTFTVAPFPASKVIEENYYLIGTINDWDVKTAVKLNRSDKSQYDDPVFTIKVEITNDQAAAGWDWKIIPESTYATGSMVNAANAAYGVAVEGDDSLSGTLVARTADADCYPGSLKVSGPYLLTLNMEKDTYEFTSAVENLYTPGDSNGWNQEASQQLFTNNYSSYEGYAYLTGAFKFSSAPNWSGTNYGSAGVEGELTTDGGAGNLTVSEAGLYYCRVNTASLTYSLTQIATIGVIGDATPAGWDASTALTSDDNLIWKGTIEFKGGEFKFRCNDDWDVNLGGDMQNLTPGGANIASPGEGTYEVTLNLSQLPYSCTLEKK
ncbi:DUF5115 domain-containing protein [Muribaculaceae bacterium Isolate-037 (Harlan)]|nr:DUF5115 domain-containing protein [Muribaculaceae bacterium Isolate-037 (Harlan)]